ncbi:Protein arginine N-methyltransferase 2, partial [Colletotrichum scovillei]
KPWAPAVGARLGIMDITMSTLCSHNVLVKHRSGEAGAAAVACAENISLLYLLSKRHHEPQRNLPSSNPIGDKERMLQFSRERSLCGAFAFLSSIDGNPDFVPAVYIEELTEQQRLEIVVAVNKKSRNNGEEVLLDIKHGFEQIFQQIKGLNGKY